jgi:hypothetical protein
MKIPCKKWTRLSVSCSEFNDVAADSVISLDFHFRAGRTRIFMQSEKFSLRGKLFVLERIHHLEPTWAIEYIICIKNIDAMSLMTEESQLYVSSIVRSVNELKIIGINGLMSFQGSNLDVTFLRDDHHDWTLLPVEGVGQCFDALRRDIC